MMKRIFALTAFVAILQPATAQVALKPKGATAEALQIKSVTAHVKIESGVASTLLEMTFKNTWSRRMEADFMYVLRPNQVATGFAYYYNTERVQAYVAEKERASTIYRNIVTRQQDPALIEMIGKNTFRARIFPIEPSADLKVEMKFVESLRAEQGRLYYELPVTVPKGQPLDSLSLEVEWIDARPTELSNNLGSPIEAVGNGSKWTVEQTSVRPQKTYRIAMLPQSQKVQTLAKLSGGADGFFCATVVSATSFRNAPVSISGAKVYDVQPRRISVRAGESFMVTGRYRGAGARTLLVNRNQISLGEFGSEVAPNHPGVKLWAAKTLASIESNRAKSIQMSLRHSLPSQHTSWIAIPTAERERFAYEINMAKVVAMEKELTEIARRKGMDSREFRTKLAQADAFSKEKKLIYDWKSNVIWSEYSYYYNAASAQYAKAKPDRRRLAQLRSGWDKVAKLMGTYRNDAIRDAELNYYASVPSDYVSAVARGKSTAVLEQKLREQSGAVRDRMREQIDANATQFMSSIQLPGKVAELRLKDHKLSPNNSLTLNRLQNRFPSLISRAQLKARTDALRQVFHEEALVASKQMVVENGSLDAFKAAIEKMKTWQLELKVKAIGPEVVQRIDYHHVWQEKGVVPRIRKAVEAGTVATPEFAEQKRRLKEFAAELDIPWYTAIRNHVEYNVANWLRNLEADKLATIRDSNRIARTSKVVDDLFEHLELSNQDRQRLLRDLSSTIDYSVASNLPPNQRPRTYAGFRWERFAKTRDELVTELHKANPDQEKVKSLSDQLRNAEESNRKFRVDVILKETEIDRYLQQSMTPELHGKIDQARREAKELRARFGDPLISAKFPQNCKLVVAVLPDGTHLKLKWNPVAQAWQERFDIPLGAKEGQVKVDVYAITANGNRLSETFTYTVDLTAAKARLETHLDANTLVVALVGDKDLARVLFNLPWGQQETRMCVDGRATMRVQIPAEWQGKSIEIVAYLTDRAHNKSSQKVIWKP